MTISQALLDHIASEPETALGVTRYARVTRSVGLLLEAEGLRAPVNALCWVINTHDGELGQPASEVPCEVVGFDENRSYLMPLTHVAGIEPGALVRIPEDQKDFDRIPDPEALLGRIVDGLGQPLDGGQRLSNARVRINRNVINPMQRAPISEVLDVGVGSINAMLTVGVGQRIGLFAGSGVGKSVLLGMLARFVVADVVVVGLIGERGREVQEFVLDNLGEGLVRAVVVACPADDSPALRLRGARLATQIAEAFRDQGKNVLLLLDSLTRVAQAQREIGLAMGEPPSSKGYTPSSFACLPQLVERSGCGASEHEGAVSAFYTVLMEEDDLHDPVVDACRAILDGHIVLSRQLADQGLYPAVDVGVSISRLMQKLATPEQLERAHRVRALWQCYQEQQDLINVGAYQPGSHALTDEAIARHDAIREFLRQDVARARPLGESLAELKAIFDAPVAEQPLSRMGS